MYEEMEASKRKAAMTQQPFVPSVHHIAPLYKPPKAQQALASEVRSRMAMKARLRNGRNTQVAVTSKSPSPQTLPVLKASTDVVER